MTVAIGPFKGMACCDASSAGGNVAKRGVGTVKILAHFPTAP